MNHRKKKSKQHWYKMYYGECPVCGNDKSYRERVYGPRPRSEEKRYEFLPQSETYDNCMG